MATHNLVSPPTAPTSTDRPSRASTKGEHIPTVEECPLFDAIDRVHQSIQEEGLIPISPGPDTAPPKLLNTTPPAAAPSINLSDLTQLFSRFEAQQAARDLELQQGLRLEIEQLRSQVVSLSTQLHNQPATPPTATPSAATPIHSSEASPPPLTSLLTSTTSIKGIGTYLGDDQRVMEPDLAPSRHIESLTPLNLLAPTLISLTSSRCVTDIDSLLSWARKQSPSLFSRFDDSLRTLMGVHEALGAIYQKILSINGSSDAVASLCFIRLLEIGEGNEHGEGAAAIAFNVSRIVRACLKTADDQMRVLWSQVNSGTVPEELLSLPNTYINQMYDPRQNSNYT